MTDEIDVKASLLLVGGISSYELLFSITSLKQYLIVGCKHCKAVRFSVSWRIEVSLGLCQRKGNFQRELI